VVLQHAKLLDHAVASARSELDFLSSIVDEMPEVVLIFDANDELLLSNQKTQQLFDAELSHGCHLMALTKLLNFPADTFENLINQTENSPQQVLIPLATKLGTRDFVLKTASLNAPLGRSLRLLLLMDITELRQSQKQRDRALQLLSHDMRTPVASILSLLPSQDCSNEKITQHAQSLLQMMDDFILTISSEATQYKVQSESLDNLINDSLEQVADLAHAKNIYLSDESHTSHLFVMANTRLLVRAFVNLLFNAIKFSPSQSTIQIQSLHVESSETSSTQVTLVISNLVSAVCSEIDITQTLQGFGLGLDFVDTVIHKHQGTIERHIPAHGVATVVITLPCEISQIAL
jgi:signal transduction histidine kinase